MLFLMPSLLGSLFRNSSFIKIFFGLLIAAVVFGAMAYYVNHTQSRIESLTSEVSRMTVELQNARNIIAEQEKNMIILGRLLQENRAKFAQAEENAKKARAAIRQSNSNIVELSLTSPEQAQQQINQSFGALLRRIEDVSSQQR